MDNEEKKDKNEDLIQFKKLESQLPAVKEYNHKELLELSIIYYKSNLLPSHFKTAESAYIGMRWCLGLGIDPFLGLRDIFVIDNIPSVRTEAAIAMVEASGFCENIEQRFEGEPYKDDFTAVCVIKRKGRKEHISKFSVKEARAALLWEKKTPNGKPTSWITYPKRMLMYRAIGFALRDIFPDVLRGAKLYEEVIDYRDVEIVSNNSKDGQINVEVKSKQPIVNRATKVKSNLNDLPPSDDVQDIESEEVK